MAVTGTLEKPIIGLTGEFRLDEGRELLECPIQHPRINQLMAALPTLIRQCGLTPYQIEKRTGELKGLIAFYSPLSEQMYLRFVLHSRAYIAQLNTQISILSVLQEQFSELVCISANIQPIPHAILEGPEEIILTKRDSIDHQIGDLCLKLTPQAFVQTNFSVSTELYQTAARWIGISKAEKVLSFLWTRSVQFFCRQERSPVAGY